MLVTGSSDVEEEVLITNVKSPLPVRQAMPVSEYSFGDSKVHVHKSSEIKKQKSQTDYRLENMKRAGFSTKHYAPEIAT